MNPNDETYVQPSEIGSLEPKTPNNKVMLLATLLLLALAILVVFTISTRSNDAEPGQDQPTLSAEDAEETASKQESRQAVSSGIVGNNPEQLQNLLLEDLKAGVNDKFTKTHAYFVTHRFYDNGGDIYEIYNYINSYPELAFLEEAESIYPEYFDLIAKNQLPKTYTDRGNLANMAYAEVLEQKGYADTALLGTLANQYAKTALFLKLYATEDDARADMFNSLADSLLIKSQVYALKARPKALGIIDGSVAPTTYTSHDAMVGLNQYASALRYLTAHGIVLEGVDSAKEESAEIFNYTARLAQRDVTELINFTALIDASTLVIAGNQDIININKALEPIIAFDTKATKPIVNGAIDRIIKARNEVVAPKVIDRKLDVYSKTNIAGLAAISPDFRAWLMTNGWTEADLDLDLFVLEV